MDSWYEKDKHLYRELLQGSVARPQSLYYLFLRPEESDVVGTQEMEKSHKISQTSWIGSAEAFILTSTSSKLPVNGFYVNAGHLTNEKGIHLLSVD